MLRSAALSLQDGVAEDVLLNRLKARVPVCPRDQAHLITGSFDEIVSRLRRLSSAQVHREAVREVSETVNDAAGGSSSTANKYATHICHYCQKRGHIARHCEKKKADMIAKQSSGNRPRRCPADAGRAPENTK